MPRSRGISCSQCSGKIDRYDDSISCNTCDNAYHIKCVNLSVDEFNKIRENNANKWFCVVCCQSGSSIPTFSDQSTQADTVQLTKKDLIRMKDDIVSEVTTLFLAEIDNLKKLITFQNKQIIDLTEEISSLKKHNKNVISDPYAVDNSDNVIHRNIRAESSSCVAHVHSDDKIVRKPDEESIVGNNSEGNKSNEWTLVTAGRRQNRLNPPNVINANRKISPSKNLPPSQKRLKPIIGTQKGGGLHVVPKKPVSHLHVTRLGPETTIADLQDFFNKNSYEVSIEKLNSRKPELYSSFKIALPSDHLDEVMNPTFWPVGVAVNRFFMKRRQENSKS